MKKLVLIGGGGHCKACIDVIEATEQYQIIGILDKDFEKNETILGYPILGNDDLMEELVSQDILFFITVGQIKSSNIRLKLFEKIKILGGKLVTIISPYAIISKHTQIGEGSIMMHGSVANADSSIGKNVIINTKSLIEHDVSVGNHCHISTNAVLNGGAIIHQNCFIGSSAVINQGVEICSNTVIGSNSTVIQNITKAGIYVGSPARPIH
jgi:sugar O-acyltransferase (sialic acid O-acetyltransferase NeuD family)